MATGRKQNWGTRILGLTIVMVLTIGSVSLLAIGQRGHASWQHSKEWRLIHDERGRFVIGYPADWDQQSVTQPNGTTTLLLTYVEDTKLVLVVQQSEVTVQSPQIPLAWLLPLLTNLHRAPSGLMTGPEPEYHETAPIQYQLSGAPAMASSFTFSESHYGRPCRYQGQRITVVTPSYQLAIEFMARQKNWQRFGPIFGQILRSLKLF